MSSVAIVTATEASLWHELQERAASYAKAEPALQPMLDRYVLARRDFGDGLARRISERITASMSEATTVGRVFDEMIARDATIVQQARGDLRAILERDPAAEHALLPYLWYKGFHAITCHRFAHALWKAGRREMAFHIQSLSSEHLAVDIHPAARFGTGILLDHATGFVAGETAVVEDNVSFLHEVTLGGTGKQRADRDVSENLGTAAGVPAVIVGQGRMDTPALDMDHTI